MDMTLKERIFGCLIAMAICVVSSAPTAWFWSDEAREVLYELPPHWSGPFFLVALISTLITAFSFFAIFIIIFDSED